MCDNRMDRLLEGIKARKAHINRGPQRQRRLYVVQHRATYAKTCARGMAPDPMSTASRSVLVVVMSSPHKTYFRACKQVRYDASVDTMPAKGQGADDVPRMRYRTMRMNASPAFPSFDDESLYGLRDQRPYHI